MYSKCNRFVSVIEMTSCKLLFYDVAVKARNLYATAYRQHFLFSAEVMAWEIWLHAAPETLDTLIDNKIVRFSRILVLLITGINGMMNSRKLTK